MLNCGLILLTALFNFIAIPVFPWNGVPHFTWFFLVPYFFVVSKEISFKKVLLYGLLTSFLISLGWYYWVATGFHLFLHFNWIICIGLCCIFSLFAQLQYLLFSVVFFLGNRNFRYKEKSVLFIILLGLIFSGLDAVLPKLFHTEIAHVFYNSPLLIQTADIGGAGIVTFLIFTVNYCIFLFLKEFIESKSVVVGIKKNKDVILFTVSLFLMFISYGKYRISEIQKIVNSSNKYKISLIQGSDDFTFLSNEEKRKIDIFSLRFDKYISLSEKSLDQDGEIRLFLWPENSVIYGFTGEKSKEKKLAIDQAIDGLLNKAKASLLYGSLDRIESKGLFNSAFLRSLDQPPQVYHKNILFPIGETKFLGMKTIQLAQGEESSNMTLNLNNDQLFIGPSICYEILDPNYTRKSVTEKTNLLANLSSESWFGKYGVPSGFLSQSVFRATELRIPLAKVSTTGYSAFISPTGEIIQKSKLWTEDVIIAEVPLVHISSFVKSYGYLFSWIGLFSGIAIFLLKSSFHKKDSDKKR